MADVNDIRREIREELAFHEAGHAFVAYQFGCEIFEVSICDALNMASERGGYCRVREEMGFPGMHWMNPRPPTHAEQARRTAICLLAGPAAEARYLDMAVEDIAELGDEDDSNDLPKAIEVLRRWRPRAQMWRIYRQAEQRIEANWHLVTAIAEALLERETITGDDVAEIIAARAEAA